MSLGNFKRIYVPDPAPRGKTFQPLTAILILTVLLAVWGTAMAIPLLSGAGRSVSEVYGINEPVETSFSMIIVSSADGLTGLTSQDLAGENTSWDGLYGAMVVAQPGAKFTNLPGQPVDIGSQVNVKVPASAQHPNGQIYRDFPLLLADHDPIPGQDTMPYPTTVSGPSLINYQTAGLRVDNADMFSSTVNGDPVTPLLRTYAGNPVKIHVLGAPASKGGVT